MPVFYSFVRGLIDHWLKFVPVSQEEHAPDDQRPGGARGGALASGWDPGAGLDPGLLLHMEGGGVDWKGVSCFYCF